MIRTIFSVLILLCLPLGLFGQQQATNLKNDDVVGMVKAGLAPDIIIAKIKSSTCDFDTSPDSLKGLKNANVPNGVILAMVEAPRTKLAEANPSSPQFPHSYLGILFLNADPPAHGIVVKRVAPTGPGSRVGLQEGDIVRGVNGQPITDMKDYAQVFLHFDPGTQVRLTVLRGTQQLELTATTAPPSPQLVTVVKAIAYKSLPYYSKTVYQIGPGSSNTTCNGSTYGNINATAQPNYSGGASINGTVNADTITNCNTTYQPPQQDQINWRTIYNYNLVEGGGYRFVILCTASVRWSKCSYLIPGGMFAADVEGGQMWISASKNGKKTERIKYDILQAAPIQ